jgi:hypothetical protein
MNKPARTSSRRTPTTKVTKKEPVKVEPSFTVIRDGEIRKQEPVTNTASADDSKGK